MHKKNHFNQFLVISFCIFFYFTNSYLISVWGLEKGTPDFCSSENKNIETTCTIKQETEFQTEELSLSTPAQEVKTEIESKLYITEKVTAKPQEKKIDKNFGSFKSYTDYRCLSRSSKQWMLQKEAYTDENGLRKIEDAYLVALGSYYGTILGTKYEVTLSNGSKFKIILCDCKDDRHTDKTNKYTLANGCVLEFYVETEKMPSVVRRMGSISAIEFFGGSVVSIEKMAE